MSFRYTDFLIAPVTPVSATIAMIASTCRLAALTAQLQRWEPRCLANALGSELIDGYSSSKIGTISLARMFARQKGGHGPCMIAAAVAVGAPLSSTNPLRTNK